jgi:copper transport protein
LKPIGSLSALLAALLLLLAPSPASAHLHLTGSTPAADDSLSAAPTEIRLSFTEDVELRFSDVSLIGPMGEVRIGEIFVPVDSPSVLAVRVLGGLSAGEYTVRWRAASADGHPMNGEYRFTILPGAAGLQEVPAAPPPAAAPTVPRTEAPAAARFGVQSAGYVAVRWGTFVALLAVIGAVAFRLLVLGRVPDGAALVEAAAPRAARLGLWAAAFLLIAGFLRLAAESLAVFGDAPSLPHALPMLLGTLWGWGWLLQIGATLVALAGFLLARRGADLGWLVAVLGAVALAFTPALSGHAAGAHRYQSLAIVADGLHVFGVGGWLGSLLVVLTVGLPTAVRLDRDGKGRALVGMAASFSATALFFAALVLLTGLFASWLHLGSLAALTGSRYGRTLLVKLAAVAVVAAAGLFNWRRARPALDRAEGAQRFRRSAAIEVAAALLVLAVTAALVATPPPGH